jgi:hypothetical protein
MFAESCHTGKPGELTAENGYTAVAVVYAALRSIEKNGQLVRIADMITQARAKVPENSHVV